MATYQILLVLILFTAPHQIHGSPSCVVSSCFFEAVIGPSLALFFLIVCCCSIIYLSHRSTQIPEPEPKNGQVNANAAPSTVRSNQNSLPNVSSAPALLEQGQQQQAVQDANLRYESQQVPKHQPEPLQSMQMASPQYSTIPTTYLQPTNQLHQNPIQQSPLHPSHPLQNKQMLPSQHGVTPPTYQQQVNQQHSLTEQSHWPQSHQQQRLQQPQDDHQKNQQLQQHANQQTFQQQEAKNLPRTLDDDSRTAPESNSQDVNASAAQNPTPSIQYHTMNVNTSSACGQQEIVASQHPSAQEYRIDQRPGSHRPPDMHDVTRNPDMPAAIPPVSFSQRGGVIPQDELSEDVGEA